jgi:protein-S-isoprenylcysteine O-methyltransferase Ste14
MNPHMLHTLLGLKGDPHMDPFHILSNVLIVFGLFLLANSWRVLYAAQKTHTLATSGPYAYIRHPQYIAFIAVMFGFLLQWPTIPTLVMFPVLVWMYVRLAKAEERQVRAEFAEAYIDYASRVPAFIPHLRSRSEAGMFRPE